MLNSPNEYKFYVEPRTANKPRIVTGTSTFLKLNISAIRQKTPSPVIANSVIIMLIYFYINLFL